MPQTSLLLDTLKHELRRQGRTYADAAVVLGLSEASVKRLFSEQAFSLERLDRLCEWLGLEISDLVDIMEERRARVTRLDEAQERELVHDARLLLMTLCVLNRWRVEEIVKTYRISDTEAVRLLARLDRMGLIQLLPGNRVKRLVARNFAWTPDGPIQRFFEEQVQQEFFRSRFNGPGECRLVLNGMLSARANAEIRRRLERLATEFNTLHEEDENLPHDDRHGTTLVMAMRPWEASIFEQLRREPSNKRYG